MIHRDATPIAQGENIWVYDLLLMGISSIIRCRVLCMGSSLIMFGIVVQNVRFTRIREYPFSCFSSTGCISKIILLLIVGIQSILRRQKMSSAQ